MSLRQLQVTVPKGQGERAVQLALAKEADRVTLMKAAKGDETELVIITTRTGTTEKIIEVLKAEFKFKTPEDGIITLFSVEATVPPIEKRDEVERAAREEMYANVLNATNVSSTYFLLVILSTIIATFALMQNSAAVVIGAMIIAPLLGPAIGMSLGTVIGDRKLLRKGIWAEICGIGLAILIAATLSSIFLDRNPDPASVPREILTRCNPSVIDIALAVGAGTAGALCFVSGLNAVLVGVMVAIALLPPAAVVGIGIGYHEWVISVRALMLLIINIACINISGTLTFRLKGVRGATWWREKKAKESTRLMLAGWIITLVLLAGMLVLDGVLTQRYPDTFGRFRISKKAGILGIY
jgi:uncharacterized hydrophobic protein (TIGR00341 family)